MLTAQDKGRLFEKNIHSFLQQTKLNVLTENDVKKKYGIDTTAIDHLIELDFYILCFQDKCEKSSPSVSQINHFIQCVNNISFRSNKICIGIYLSMMPLSQNSLYAFYMQNQNNELYNKFISINSSNENKVLYKLTQFLYENNIFLYEEDGSCIMLY